MFYHAIISPLTFSLSQCNSPSPRTALPMSFTEAFKMDTAV